MLKSLKDTVELIWVFSVYKFPDTMDFDLLLKFESCQNVTCLDFNEFNEPPTYHYFTFSLMEVEGLDRRLIIDETVGEVEIIKGKLVTLANR